MDSVTHIVLGAAIGDRLLGNKIGRKAALIGAFVKTFPDFDLLYSGLSDPRKYILYHRSYTHSFFVELLTAFPLAWMFYLLFKKKISYKSWFVFCLIGLWCHSLVDVCTNYGTRLFLPFTNNLYALNNIAIADLFFTLPMLLMVVVALIYKNESKTRIWLMRSILIYAILYLGMTFINKGVANNYFKKSLSENKISYNEYMSNPTILNNIMWYCIVNNDSTLKIAEYSLLQKNDSIRWLSYPINKKLLDSCKSTDATLLRWFSQGFYFTYKNKDTLEVFTPKFGRGNFDKTEAKETFLFYYKLYQQDGKWIMDSHEPSDQEMNIKEGFIQLVKKVKGG